MAWNKCAKEKQCRGGELRGEAANAIKKATFHPPASPSFPCGCDGGTAVPGNSGQLTTLIGPDAPGTRKAAEAPPLTGLLLWRELVGACG